MTQSQNNGFFEVFCEGATQELNKDAYRFGSKSNIRKSNIGHRFRKDSVNNMSL